VVVNDAPIAVVVGDEEVYAHIQQEERVDDVVEHLEEHDVGHGWLGELLWHVDEQDEHQEEDD